MFSVHGLRGAGDAASYSTKLARGKSFSDSISYELAFSTDHLQIIYTHQCLGIRMIISVSIGHIIGNLIKISNNQLTDDYAASIILTLLAVIIVGWCKYTYSAPWKTERWVLAVGSDTSLMNSNQSWR